MSEKLSALRSLAEICFLDILCGMWSSLITGCSMWLVCVVICIVVYICLSPKLIGIHPSGCERHRRIQIFFQFIDQSSRPSLSLEAADVGVAV